MPKIFKSKSLPKPREKESAPSMLENQILNYRIILVPIDFSEHSAKTIEYAAKLAARFGSEVKLLNVLEIPDYITPEYQKAYLSENRIVPHIDVAEREITQKLLVREEEFRSREIPVESYFRVGCPFEEIVSMSNHFSVDLIVIGSHGHTGIKRLLLGSTAERVVQHAHCPVLVVKGG
jgi:nucleotide-binding universal stress UspA family protein